VYVKITRSDVFKEFLHSCFDGIQLPLPHTLQEKREFFNEEAIWVVKESPNVITYLDLSSMDIVDIAGIENFTNLQTINLGYNNNLENVDVLSLLPQIKSIVLNGTKVENIECLINKESVEEIIIYKENLQVYNNKEEKIELPKYIYQSLKLQEGVTAKAVIYYDVLDTTRGGGGDFPINDYNNFEIVNINLDDEKEVATIDLDRSITNEKKKGIRAIVVTIEGGKTLNSEYKCYYEVDKELTGISINGYTSDNYYFIEGQDFNRNGLQVVAMYNDGSSEIITDYDVIDGEDLKPTQHSVTISYTEDGITKTTTQEIMVQAQNIEKLEINIEEYQQEQDGEIKYINNINPGVTIGQILEKIQVNASATKEVYDGTTEVSANGILATGMKIIISLNSQIAEYIVVVSGDINGDAQITATDLTRMKNHILEKTTLTNLELKAADLNNDGQITATELTKIKKYVLGIDVQLH